MEFTLSFMGSFGIKSDELFIALNIAGFNDDKSEGKDIKIVLHMLYTL